MGLQIEDGKGSGQLAGVSRTGNRFNVSSRSDGRIYYISRDNGDAYTMVSIDTPSAGGEYNFYFKNTSTTQKFYVTHIEVGAADLAIFKLSTVTGTAAGTAITPVNLNRTSGNVASATCLGNGAVTGLTEEHVLKVISVNADDSKDIKLDDALILGQGDAIAVEFDTGSASAIHIDMQGFYDVE
jgi:hypothetical protein